MAEAVEARAISILGATGSIGESTLDLVKRADGAYRVEAVTAHTDVAGLARAARDVGARFAAVGDPSRYDDLKQALDGSGIACGAGGEALNEAAQRPSDWVMAAIVGTAGLSPTLAAVRRGATVALANKEALVCAGDIVMREARRSGSTILPVDSEHNAIHQVFDYARVDAVERLILTASGGPFRRASLAEMRDATPKQALAHPNWSMGAKISVDSATMMNKGLEVIEACHLFPVGQERIETVVHPESIVHGMVEYVDGSVLAQLGAPDMRTPIAYTLAWPDRAAGPSSRLDLTEIGSISFHSPDFSRFPSLGLARSALMAGGRAPVVLNAANEVAVRGFLDGAIGFLDIVDVVERTLERMGPGRVESLEDIVAVDLEARRRSGAVVSRPTAR